MESFWAGFEKAAAEEKADGHHVRRFFLGNPISAAIEAEKGHKLDAFGDAYGHVTTHQGVGGLAGGGLGAGLGALGALATKRHPGIGAGIGALLGGSLGGGVGTITGTHGAKASEIHGRYSKNKKKD